MAFLDNSGDIILDAVLTDTGRYRMAKGDGSFKITKFALGDDEINYGSYNKNHPSGSAYYDLEVLQTPILEAFTNNTSTMQSKLISIARTNLLYLPVIIPNNITSNTHQSSSAGTEEKIWVVAVDSKTAGEANASPATNVGFCYDGGTSATPVPAYANGILDGVTMLKDTQIRVDQGLNTTQIPKANTIDSELLETQYIIEMDNRFGSVVDGLDRNYTPAKISFIDDDNIASYYLSLTSDPRFVFTINPPTAAGQDESSIKGPTGTRLNFKIMASTELRTSTYLFEKLGSINPVGPQNIIGTNVPIRYIDTIIKVTGATTGYRVDIPIRYIKMRDQ